MSNRPKAKQIPSARVAEAQKHAGAGSRSTLWVVGIVVLVVVLAGVIAVVATRPKDAPSGSGAAGTVVPAGDLNFGDVVVTGSALPDMPATGGADPAVGQTVPKLEGEQFNGAALTIPSAGTPKVVMFVAHWCPHCQAEVPVITEYLNQKGLPAGVDLYAVATGTSDQKPNYPPSQWLNKAGWPVRTLADDKTGKAANAYGVTGFPYFVVVDANGKVVTRTSGELTTDQFQALIDQARSAAPSTGATVATGPASAAKP